MTAAPVGSGMNHYKWYAALAYVFANKLSDQSRSEPGSRAAFLPGLPLQHIDQGSGRFACIGRYRLPLRGPVDGPRNRRGHHRRRLDERLDRDRHVHDRNPSHSKNLVLITGEKKLTINPGDKDVFPRKQ